MNDRPNYVPHGAVSTGDLIHSDDEGDAFEVMEILTGPRGSHRIVRGWYYADDANIGDLTEAAGIAVAASDDAPLLAIAREAFDRNLWKGALMESCTGRHREATIDYVTCWPDGAMFAHVTVSGSFEELLVDTDPDLDPFGWRVRTEKGVPIMP